MNRCKQLIVAALVLSLGTFSLPVAAAQPPVADVKLAVQSVEWQPLVDNVGIWVRIAGPDGAFLQKRFGAGRNPSFQFESESWPDGTYTWEIVAVPRLTPSLRAELLAARASGDDAAVRRLQKQVPGPYVQSGSFRIDGGAAVLPGAIEAPTRHETTAQKVPGLGTAHPADQQIADDLIVTGNACVGADCVNGEVFGAQDTLLLKDQIVGLSLVDTSTLAGFPARDWQFAANDPLSGGAEYLAVNDVTAGKTPFKVMGNAPTNSIFVSGSGSVGLGTAAPATELHISSGNLPELRLEQNTSGGFAARSWDVQADHSAFSVEDVTGATTPFKISTGAPTDSLTVASNGWVSVGPGAPLARFTVQGTMPGDALMRVRNMSNPGYSGIEFIDNAGTAGFFFGVNNSNSSTRLNSFNNFPFLLMTNSVEHLRIQPGGNIGINCATPGSNLVIASGAGCSNPASSLNAGATQFTVTSSRTFKENLSPVEVHDILDRVSAIDVYHYDFINGPKDRIGLVAEDFHQVFGRGSDKLLDGSEVQMALWLAAKELTVQNKQRVTELEALRQENRELRERLLAIEARLSEAPRQ